nr:RNA-directed DNA polymerase homolog [Tanacetum cinerariifolium]
MEKYDRGRRTTATTLVDDVMAKFEEFKSVKEADKSLSLMAKSHMKSLDTHVERNEKRRVAHNEDPATTFSIEQKNCEFGTLQIDPQKVKAITDWPRPSSVTEIRTFMGAYQYLNKFIRQFLVIASPLHALTKANSKFEWMKILALNK